MNNQFTFTIKNICLDENYQPSDSTRITTNFANLARGESRQQNLRKALKMIDNSFNALAYWDNPKADRYSVELEIVSVVERALLVEMVADGGMNGGELLQTSHATEPLHCSLSSSEREMRILRPIVEPAASFVAVGIADILHRSGCCQTNENSHRISGAA